ERLNGAARPTAVTVAEVNALLQLPFIRQIVSHTPGRELVAVCDIDLEEDLFLKEHTLAGRISMTDENLIGLPVMPLTVSMEILAEAAFRLQPQRVVVGMRDVRAYRWLTVDEDRLRLHVTALLVTPDEVNVQLREADAIDPSRPKPGLPVIEAVVIFGDTYPRGETIESFDLHEARASKWRTGAMYDRTGMFHGPLFQWVTSMERTSADGAIATFSAQPNHTFFRSNPQPAFLIDPVLLDAMGQVVGYWTGDQFQRGLSVFPFKLERLDLHSPPLVAGEEARCYLRVNFVDDEWIRSDIDVIRSDGTLLARMNQWEDRRLDLPRRVYDFRIAPHEVLLSDDWSATLPVSHQLRACRISRLPEDLFEAHGAIWLRVLAYMILNRRERQTWRELNAASSKRRRDWLLGRIAAKDAVRLLLKEQWGLMLCPADIEITSAASGRPEMKGNWLPLVEQPPIVSIAHSGDVAIALVSADKNVHGVGIDLEPIDRVGADIERVAFTPHEQQLLSSVDRSEWATRLWCAKEAAGKAVGCGLIGGPRELEIQEVDCGSGVVVVKLLGELARDLVELADKPIVVQTVREDEWIMAVAML
ncbi:MAG: 4'-phosphopantetheinyl transferase superfamily protein, partial [Chloroflexi bacterium]|nr:4'-phosphopantetheinyl transferase superfamily protein [Chloroflexota bacterium]